MGLLPKFGDGCGVLGIRRHLWEEKVPIPGAPIPDPLPGRKGRKRRRKQPPFGTYTVKQLPACKRCGKPNPNYVPEGVP